VPDGGFNTDEPEDVPEDFEPVRPAGSFQPLVPLGTWAPPPIPSGSFTGMTGDPGAGVCTGTPFGTDFFAGDGDGSAKHGEFAATQTAETSARKLKKRVSTSTVTKNDSPSLVATDPIPACGRNRGLTLGSVPVTISGPKKVARAPSPDAFGRSGRTSGSRR
jgi:hypothetical protein